MDLPLHPGSQPCCLTQKAISVPGRIVTFSTKTGLLGRWKRDLAI
jgi:hypothetical protein